MAKSFGAAVEFPAVTTPSGNPPSGKFWLYLKSDGRFYIKNNAGVETLYDSALVDLASNQTVTGVKTFGATKLIMTSGVGTGEPYSDANPPQTLLMTEFATGSVGTIASGYANLTTPDGANLWMKDDSQQWRLVGPTVETFTFSKQGVLTTGVGTSQIPIVGGTFRILTVAARVETAPTGASVLVDVNKNGTTIYGTQSNRPTIAASGNNATVGANSVTDFTTNDYISVDVDQVGSTVAGSNLVVVVRMIRIS